MTQFRNVIVFGDSFSDIGIKDTTLLGWLVKKDLPGVGPQLTTNPSGRFSDCRNWTDFMYESATGGKTLIQQNEATTRAASKKHQSFTTQSQYVSQNGEWFRYANYAVGGAYAGNSTFSLQELMKHIGKESTTKIVTSGLVEFGLSTLSQQIKQFLSHYSTMCKTDPGIAKEDFLFIIWIGANDLYTIGRTAQEMGSVALNVAVNGRNEIAAIVGENRAYFVFVNLPLPSAARRYKNQLDSAESKEHDLIQAAKANQTGLPTDSLYYKARKNTNDLTSGAILFNSQLRRLLNRNEVYVDMASILTPNNINEYSQSYFLSDEEQKQGTSNNFIGAKDYDLKTGKIPLSTSDLVHPTDPVYRIMWGDAIGKALLQAGYSFGAFGTYPQYGLKQQNYNHRSW